MVYGMIERLRLLRALLLVVMILGLGVGCTDTEELTPEKADALTQRVEARWQALVARDFRAAYEFETPNYRSVFTPAMYEKRFSYGVEWELTGVDIIHYDARAAVASVVARVMSRSTKPTSAASKALGALPVRFREKWLLIDGEWWHSVKS